MSDNTHATPPDVESFPRALEIEQATIQRFSACYAESNAYERIAARARGMEAVAALAAVSDAAAGEVAPAVYESLIQFMSIVGQDMQRDALQLEGERAGS